jgi:hypothetical protein
MTYYEPGTSVSYRIVICGILLSAFVMTACTRLEVKPTPTSMPNVPTQDLVVDAVAFPSNWVVAPCEPDCARQYQDEESSRTFYQEGTPGHAIQVVSRFAGPAAAEAKFELYERTEFSKSRHLPSTEFAPSPDIVFRSPIADQYDVRCGVEQVPVCKAIARYGQYFVYFYFDLDSWLWYGLENQGDGLAAKDIELILRAADELIAARFQIPLSAIQSSPAPQLDTPYPLPPTPAADVPELIQALSSDDAQERIGASYMLALKPDEAAQAVSALISNLQHPMPDVRFAALRALEAIGCGAQAAVSAASDALINDEVYDVRNEAAIALGKICSLAAVPALATALYDKDLSVQRNAAEALAILTGEDFPTVSANGNAFDANGNLIVVLAAREWWQQDGQHRVWP